MSGTFLGSVSLADAIPLLKQIKTAELAIQAQLQAILSFSATIRILALADIEAQLSASLNIQLGIGLSLADPVAYLEGLLSAVLQVQANLALLLPVVSLSAQLSASLAISAELEIKIAAFDIALNILVSISAAIGIAINIPIPDGTLEVYAVDGVIGSVGPDLQTTINANTQFPPGSVVKAVVLVATDPATIAGMQTILLTT